MLGDHQLIEGERRASVEGAKAVTEITSDPS